MARPTKKSAAQLRGKLKEAAKKRPKPARRLDLPSITLERLRIGALMARLEKHALGELSSRRKQGFDSAMTVAQQQAAQHLISLVIPKAELPPEESNRSVINVIVRDPRDRPEGYARKGAATLIEQQ